MTEAGERTVEPLIHTSEHSCEAGNRRRMERSAWGRSLAAPSLPSERSRRGHEAELPAGTWGHLLTFAATIPAKSQRSRSDSPLQCTGNSVLSRHVGHDLHHHRGIYDFVPSV